MIAKLIDFGKPRLQAMNDLNGLRLYLSQLVGQPFQFARVSYGDELTLHFGSLRPARSSKLKDKLYGTFVLGTRGSPWKLALGSLPAEVSGGTETQPDDIATVLSSDEIEKKELVAPDALVVDVRPFIDKSTDRFGLLIILSDGSRVLVLPASPSEPENGEDEAELPQLADWELLTPHGLISAGPGDAWSFEPTNAPKAKRKAVGDRSRSKHAKQTSRRIRGHRPKNHT